MITLNTEHITVILPGSYLPEGKVISAEDVFKVVSIYTMVRNMAVKSRKKEFAYARHLYCYISRKLTHESQKSIAALIGERHHTTVIHSCNKLQDLYDTDSTVRNDVEAIMNIIRMKKVSKN